jgi:hypothetical protein
MSADDLYITGELRILKTPFDADCWIDGELISRKLSAAGHFAESLSFPMYLCPECGNKRCPKATWHEMACTHSNEPGQLGSFYGTLTEEEQNLLADAMIEENE